MKKRTKGNGHLFKRGKIYYLQYDVCGKRKVVSLRTTRLRTIYDDAGTLIEEGAEDKSKRYLAARDAKTQTEITRHIGEAKGLLSKNRIPLGDAWFLFERRYAKKKTNPSTMKNYERQWNRFVNWLQTSYPQVSYLADVSTAVADDYVDFLEHGDKKVGSASTFNQHIGTCRRIFDVLRKDVALAANPFSDAERMASDSVPKKELSERQLATLLAVFSRDDFDIAHKEELEILFHIGAWTGLRLKDATLLRWSDVDMVANLITCVPHKTRRHGTRVRIPLHPTLAKQLHRAKAWCGGEYVLPSLAAQYSRNSQTLKRNVVRVFKKAGFQTCVRVQNRNSPTNVIGFHSLRHSFVSFCANAGVPLTSVQAIIGHTSPAMTAHYAHLTDTAAQKAIDALPFSENSSTSDGNAGVPPCTPRDLEPERAEFHKLADDLPIETIRRILRYIRETQMSESSLFPGSRG